MKRIIVAFYNLVARISQISAEQLTSLAPNPHDHTRVRDRSIITSRSEGGEGVGQSVIQCDGGGGRLYIAYVTLTFHLLQVLSSSLTMHQLEPLFQVVSTSDHLSSPWTDE